MLKVFYLLNLFTVNECEIDNGGCEQICTDTFLSYNCSCKDGYSLNTDGSCSGITSQTEITVEQHH